MFNFLRTLIVLGKRVVASTPKKQVASKRVVTAQAIRKDRNYGRSVKEDVAKLKVEIFELNTRLSDVSDLTLPPVIRNVAAQILCFLIGSQPQNRPPSEHFYKAYHDERNSRKEIIHRGAVILNSNWTDDKFISIADQLIDGRNHTLHAGDVEELSSMVSIARRRLDADPKMTKKLQYEALIIRNYDSLKLLFPSKRV